MRSSETTGISDDRIGQAGHGALLTIFLVSGPILGLILVIGVVVACSWQ